MKKLSLYIFFASKNEWIYFDETKWMYFFIKDDELLKNNKIWDKVSNGIKKGFDSEPVYNKKYLETKIKFYGCKMKPNFHDKGMQKEGSIIHNCFQMNVYTLSKKKDE